MKIYLQIVTLKIGYSCAVDGKSPGVVAADHIFVVLASPCIFSWIVNTTKLSPDDTTPGVLPSTVLIKYVVHKPM